MVQIGRVTVRRARPDAEVDAVDMPVSAFQRWFRPRLVVDRACALADEMGQPVRMRVWPFTMTLWPKP